MILARAEAVKNIKNAAEKMNKSKSCQLNT